MPPSLRMRSLSYRCEWNEFKLDENLPLEIAVAFQDSGHYVDVEILDHARADDRILLTMDKDIADVRLFPPSEYPGIVRFRPAASGRGEVLRFVRQALPDLLSTNLEGRLVIVSPRGIRVR
jgi:predicted nuclease of predicted toxin-antitoxin system